MDVDLHDEREYAWLLVRSDSLTGELIKIWRAVPIRAGSWLAAVFGYPVRLLVLIAAVAVSAVLGLAMLIAAAQIPVVGFAYVRRLLPDGVWLVALGLLGAALAGTLLVSIGRWLQAEARGETPDARADSAKAERWDRWRSIHIGHESARSGLFGGLSIALGVVIQCLAVVTAGRHFEGPVESGWRWGVAFGEQLLNTLLLGIPADLLPSLSAIRPTTVPGRLLTIGVDVFYVAGVIAMTVLVLAPAFKLRALFNGTTRDLADFLENFDISRGDRLMIHRVAVVRPLDGREVVSLSKAAFVERVTAAGSALPDGGATPAAAEPPASP